MTNWFHSWRAAVRIARRDAWRYKGRSFLVLAMIALPILGVSAADLTLRSSELSTEESLARSLGAADARLTESGYGSVPVFQDPTGGTSAPAAEDDDKPFPDGGTDVTKAIPAGASVLTDSTGTAKLTTEYGLLQTEVRELKADDPMARGMLTLLDGRFPQKADEVAVTEHFLETSGLRVGSSVTARGFERTYRITGVYELPGELTTDQVNALPGAFLGAYKKAADKAGLQRPNVSTTHLLKLSGGFTWNMVKEANTKGVVVVSRAVALDPPARSEIPLYQKEGWDPYEESPGARAAALAAVGTVVGLAMLEICLLAGPAFAVGARRSRRQLGLVGANGGDRRHIRAIVLSGGLVIGAAAAVVGTALGLILTYALRPVLEDYIGRRFGSFDIRPLELLGIALLAVLTGLFAAIVPAITSSRQSVLASLTGRRGVRRSNRVLPLVGLGAVLLGAAIALYGSVISDQFVVVAGGSAIAELGVVAMTPALVGMFGRTGRWLPLSPRLALRDAVRNRGRTAPAVAAVLAAVAGTVAVATYGASEEAQRRAEYRASLPHGAVSAFIEEDGGRDVPAVRDAVQRLLPIDLRADVDRVSVGRTGCSVYSRGSGCGLYELVIPKAHECPLWISTEENPDPLAKLSPEEIRKLSKDWRCKESDDNGVYVEGGLLIGDAKVLKVLGIKDAAAEQALAAGKLVTFTKPPVDTTGKVGIRLITDPDKADEARMKGTEPPGKVVSLPAHLATGEPRTYGVKALLTPAAAKAAGLTTVPYGALFSTDRMPGSEQRQKLDAELARLGSGVQLHVEEGYVSENGIVLLALTVFAGLVTIGAAGIATGLAQADAEADLKTLSAVGAPPRVRRTLSGFQCGVVAAMGVVLGSAAGVLPAMGLRLTEGRERQRWYEEALAQGFGDGGPAPYVPIVIPWATLATLLIVVPTGAAVLAALVTRSRGALARRAAT
ncbi:FtsX-like permease family protein [Streptomyces solicathayae]|uniref:FtsX-like permease family protein n=1 Tax=Streptomyces solicathayae TaxID=3081768 RepID=A0ABZ0LUS4_9ACTN|nr:FtsX-like permease family protein [Streptomyces sp. HUAS YS2]WOX23194.1 FtsX-like permease family protein [Streptomyces sp. HUAS YS2]